MKNQLQPEEAFKLTHQFLEGKSLLTISPELPSEGFHAATIELTPEQTDLLKKQIESGVAFSFLHTIEAGKLMLQFAAAKINIKANYNFQTIEISQEQWDALRFTFMTMINDAKGITKLAYFQ